MNQALGWTEVIQWGLTLSAFLGGWLLRLLFARIDRLEEADKMHADKVSANLALLQAADNNLVQEVSHTRLDLARNYVPKSDLQQLVGPIYDTLRRIEDKLDKKADKEVLS